MDSIQGSHVTLWGGGTVGENVLVLWCRYDDDDLCLRARRR